MLVYKEVDISDSLLICDYERFKILPSVDELLDFINRLNELKKHGKYPEFWIDKEILATEFLLSKH